jgi:transcriptional regulator with XRE-family HTH domain
MTKGANFSENLKIGGIDNRPLYVYDGSQVNGAIKDRLRALRRRRQISQAEVAEYLGISKAAYGYYENGNNTPSVENLIKLALFYGVATDYLLGLADYPNGSGTSRDSFMFQLGDVSLLDKDDIEEINMLIDLKIRRKFEKKKRESTKRK